MRYFDSHAHLTSDALHPEIDAILKRSVAAGVDKILNICTDPVTLERGLALKAKYPFVQNAASTTPHDVEAEGEAVWSLMAHHARAGDLVAVGETGLDYHYEHSNRKLQQDFFVRYLHLAMECHLPVVIHCREAFADLIAILKAEYSGTGILHCFTGTVAEAEGVLDCGFYVSLSGIVTFPKSEQLREVAKMVPLDRLLIETDAPYLAPQGHRGKVNEPAFLPVTCAAIATARGSMPHEIAAASYANAECLIEGR